MVPNTGGNAAVVDVRGQARNGQMRIPFVCHPPMTWFEHAVPDI